MRSTINRSLLAAVFFAAGVGITTTLPTRAFAANDKVEFQAKKLTAPQMLAKQQQAVAYILKSYKAIDKAKRGKSAPFLKALASTAKQIETVKKAAEAKDAKTFANALPVLAQSIATLNQTFKLSGLKDKKVSTGVKTLNKMWDLYIKRVMGGKAKDPGAMAKNNGRRIREMEQRLDKMAANKMTAKQKKELDRLRKLLAKAKANNKRPSQQWYTAYIIADFAGYYAGYYYWYAAYDPTYVAFYQDSWEYFSHEVTYSYEESYSYYESYSFESYESTSVETSESYDFDYSAEEYTSFESEYEQTEDSIDQTAEEEYQATDEDDEIETADDYDDPNETVDDAGDDPDETADADSGLDEEPAADDNPDNDDDFLDEASNDDGGDDAADDDGGADEAADDGNDGADDAAMDDGNDDGGADDGADDAGADDGGSDDGGADDGGGDDGGGDDGGSDE